MIIVSAKKKLVVPFIEECIKTVEEVKLAKITLAENKNSCKCCSCTVIVGGIGAYFVYSHWYLRKDSPHVGFNTRTQTTIY